MDKLQEPGQKFSLAVRHKSVVRGVDVVDVGSGSSGLGLPGRRHDTDRDVRPARGRRRRPSRRRKWRAAERHHDRGAIDIRQYGVDSRCLGRGRRGWVYCRRRDRDGGPCRRPWRLVGKFGARPLLLVCLAVLADGLPAMNAACAQAMLKASVISQPEPAPGSPPQNAQGWRSRRRSTSRRPPRRDPVP
jgi:hypothetical protein